LLEATFLIISLLLTTGCSSKAEDTGERNLTYNPDMNPTDTGSDSATADTTDTGRVDTNADLDTATEEDTAVQQPNGDDDWGGRDTGPATGATTGCSDGEDNDGDGWSDALDPDCGKGEQETGYSGLACNDGVDNDGDGLSDSEDPECVTGGDLNETYR